MIEFTIHTSYKEFDSRIGRMRLFCQKEKINADDKETAKTIAWNRILNENPNRTFDSQNARKSHRK